MAGLSDDDARDLFEQHRDEQTGAGLEHIARSVAQFRDTLLNQGFRRKEAFKMSRDFLLELMAKTGGEDE
jgi:hypothetical protein